MRYIKFNIKNTSIIIILLFTISFSTSSSSVQAAVIGDFGFSEVISDSLPASASGYACAWCSLDYNYSCPAGYERTSCTRLGEYGTNNCCGHCAVISTTCTKCPVYTPCPGGCGDIGQSDDCTFNCPDNTGIACDDGDACTSGDTCSGGSCSGSAITCDDSNVCTNDSCSAATGCIFSNNTSSCDDGNAATNGDICGGGICSGVACPGFGNPCNRNICGGTGTILCDSICTIPAPIIFYEDVCNRNACGGTGFIDQCTGVCSAVAPPCTIICGDGLVEGLENCDTLGPVGCFPSAPVCTPTGDFTCGTCHAISGSDPFTIGGKPVVDTVKDATTYILTFAGSIALLMLIIGGIYYIVSGSNPDGQLKAKKIIVFALFGLTLVLVSYAILTVIDDFVVN